MLRVQEVTHQRFSKHILCLYRKINKNYCGVSLSNITYTERLTKFTNIEMDCLTPQPYAKEDVEDRGYWPAERYNPCVLVGNWFEERGRYLQQILRHKSTYDTDYTPPCPPLALDPNFVADKVIENRGLGSEVLIEHAGREYYNNYSTSYDLQFQYCPQGLTGARPRTFNNYYKIYEPQQDYTLNYGNVSNHRVTEAKKQQWYNEIFSWRTHSTEYTEAFPRYAKEHLNLNRIAVPRHLSSGLSPLNRDNFDVTLRGKKMGVVPDCPIKVPKKLSCGVNSGYALSPKCV